MKKDLLDMDFLDINLVLKRLQMLFKTELSMYTSKISSPPSNYEQKIQQ